MLDGLSSAVLSGPEEDIFHLRLGYLCLMTFTAKNANDESTLQDESKFPKDQVDGSDRRQDRNIERRRSISKKSQSCWTCFFPAQQRGERKFPFSRGKHRSVPDLPVIDPSKPEERKGPASIPSLGHDPPWLFPAVAMQEPAKSSRWQRAAAANEERLRASTRECGAGISPMSTLRMNLCT